MKFIWNTVVNFCHLIELVEYQHDQTVNVRKSSAVTYELQKQISEKHTRASGAKKRGESKK